MSRKISSKGKKSGVRKVTGNDVAAFCDDLIKDSKTYTDSYQESVDQEVSKSMNFFTIFYGINIRQYGAQKDNLIQGQVQKMDRLEGQKLERIGWRLNRAAAWWPRGALLEVCDWKKLRYRETKKSKSTDYILQKN